jgi:phosphatidylserine/phosphatidylglycerophosphate/cardiolipin synthase-like enzyme
VYDGFAVGRIMESAVDLIVQPDDGAAPIVNAIDAASESVDFFIFRFDSRRIQKSLEAAVERGVRIRALVAHTNSAGSKRLRQLEQTLLDAGATVARTGDGLARYHGKLLIVDGAELHVYGFNCVARDFKSRSFGLMTRDRRVVQEGLRLFEADAAKQEFEPTVDSLVVSPENAREQLATFVKRAKRQLVIYDPKLTDPQMLRLLAQRMKSGVEVRVIGRAARRATHLDARKLPDTRLHVRAMVRDGGAAFVGSQSLRPLELDGRREVGLITTDTDVVKRLLEVFEADWAATEAAVKEKAAVTEGELAFS